MVVAIKVILPVFCFGIMLYGVFMYLFNHEKNACEMTYMFEYPEYIKIYLKHEVVKKYPRYNLFVYGEGKYAEELRNSKFFGIPVLFIPGNAGSYRQVRSIASVAMRMGHSLRSPFHFNIFAIDFREELSGLYGGVLDEQTLFVQECINHIQSLYSVKKNLILIGHSMGGVISRAIFSTPQFDCASISAIYTLASPHKRPVLPLDGSSISFYNKIFDTWKDPLKSELSHIPVVSVAGGERDYVVRSELTSLESHTTLNYHAVATAIPGVWVSTDHLAIVWCKQLILTIARSMFDLIDQKTKQVTTNISLSHDILVHHFDRRSYSNHFPKLPFLFSVFSPLGQWIHQEDSSWRFSKNKILSTVYIMIPLLTEENVLVIASGLVKEDWLYACANKNPKNESKTLCLNGENFSKQGKIIPSKSRSSERRMAVLVSSELIAKGYSHVLLFLSPTNSQVDILGERYKPMERHKHFSMPSVLERLITFSPVRITSFLLAERGIFYNLTLSGFSHVIEASTLTLETRICRAGSTVGQGIINLHVPWSNEDVFYHIRTTLGGTTVVPIKLHNLPQDSAVQDVQMQILLDPECSYVLLVSFPLSDVISQFIKFYGLFIPGYCIALLLSILSGQMYAFGAKGTCPSPLYILGKFPTYLSLVLLPSVLYYGIWVTGFGPSFIPTPDHIVMKKSSFYSVVAVRSILYVVSYGMVISYNFIIIKIVSLSSGIWMWVKGKTILDVTETPLEVTHTINWKIYQENIIYVALLLAVSIGLAGSVAVLVGLYFYLSKLFIMLIKSRAEEERRGFSAATSKWHFHAMLTILWICAVLLTLPGTITWGNSLSFSLKLVNDPHTLPCFVLIISSGFLWRVPIPFFHRVFYRTASHVIHFIALLTTLYGIQSMFRLLYFISTSFAVIGIQQLVAIIFGLKQLKQA